VGGGGISAPDEIFDHFAVDYATPDVQHVTAGDMQGPDGTVLDLQATGRAVVGNPSEDIRCASARSRSVAAAPLHEGGSLRRRPPSTPSSSAYLRWRRWRAGRRLRCSGRARLGAVRDWQDSALATPRAEEIAQSYRLMRARDLSAVFDRAGTGFRRRRASASSTRPPSPAIWSRAASTPRARCDHRLANVLVEIDLLAPGRGRARVRREVAGELAAEADLPGFDTDAVLLAVEATPIELPTR
jgi:Ni/Co efflux regulator RcnB